MHRGWAIAITALITLVPALALADTLELADGTLLEGNFVGSSNNIIMFDTGAGIQAFPEEEVVALYLSAGVATAEAMAAAPPATEITLPAGTRLVLRTNDTVTSSRHGVGHRFRGQLESALVVEGVTVVPRGAFVHAQITEASQSRRAVGRSELAMEVTDILIDDKLFPVSTAALSAETSGEAARTAGRTARAAALGALASGGSGARTGAAVGLGSSLLTAGASISVPSGTILETTLTAPLTLTR